MAVQMWFPHRPKKTITFFFSLSYRGFPIMLLGVTFPPDPEPIDSSPSHALTHPLEISFAFLPKIEIVTRPNLELREMVLCMWQRNGLFLLLISFGRNIFKIGILEGRKKGRGSNILVPGNYCLFAFFDPYREEFHRSSCCYSGIFSLFSLS